MQPYDDQDQYIAVEDEEWRPYESSSEPDAKRHREDSLEPGVEYEPHVPHQEQIQAQQIQTPPKQGKGK